MNITTDLVLFHSHDGEILLPVTVDRDTVWLSLDQIAALFQRDKSTVSRHIRNVFSEGELERDSVVANFTTTAADGKKYQVDHFNLDVIISVGYRVKSQRGVEFRKWANSVLKDYILRGYAVNENRMKQLGEMVRLMQRIETNLDTKQVLSVVERFSKALDLLDDYDHQTMKRPKGSAGAYVLTYEECRQVIDQMRFGNESELFGKEKDDSFKGSINSS